MYPPKKVNGQEYWEYFLLYADDCLAVSHKGRGKRTLNNEINPRFKLKEESIWTTRYMCWWKDEGGQLQ